MSEEENNQKEISKTFDFKISESRDCLSLFDNLNRLNSFGYHTKRYTNISQENNSPPPEII